MLHQILTSYSQKAFWLILHNHSAQYLQAPINLLVSDSFTLRNQISSNKFGL